MHEPDDFIQFNYTICWLLISVVNMNMNLNIYNINANDLNGYAAGKSNDIFNNYYTMHVFL